jgi:peptidoglycan-N-acetylglucosamine deacetylase
VGTGSLARARRASILALVPAVAGLAALVSSPATGHPSHPPRTVIHDHVDAGGPLDLTRVAVTQRGKGLVISFRVHGAIVARHLDPLPRPGDRAPHFLCLVLHRQARAGSRRVCLGRPGGGRWRAGVERLSRNGEVRQPATIGIRIVAARHDEVKARIAPSAAGLVPARYLVHAETQWSGPVCRHVVTCRDRAPNGANARFTLQPVRLVGCSRAGIGVTREGPTGKNEVALTFDDGPSAYTPSVLGILNRYHVHGTFFEIGEQVSGNEEVMNEILDSGDELGDHTYHHVPDAGYTEIASAQRRIESATGFRTCLFRPPDGIYNSATVAAATKLGMSTIVWSVDPRDWSRPGTSAIYSRVVSVTRAGSIVIMHDGGGDRSETVAALPRIIRTLKGRGLHMVTVSHLLGQPMRWRPVG